MATGVGRGRICLTLFNSPTTKPPTRRRFVPNFVAMATRVGLFEISLTSFDSLTLKNPVRRKDLGDVYKRQVCA